MSARFTRLAIGRIAMLATPALAMLAAGPVLAAAPQGHHGSQAGGQTKASRARVQLASGGGEPGIAQTQNGNGGQVAAEPMDMSAMPPGADPASMDAMQGMSAPATSPTPMNMEPAQQGTAAPMDMGQMQQDAPASMDMGSMQGGRPPADARDPNAYADGYENSTLPGFEKTDKLPVSLVLADQLEFLSGNEGEGFAWSGQFARGPDNDKLWLRTQGLKVSGRRLDPETGAEALWWHGYSPFWGRTLGVRQDFGHGAHTWLAFGIEGLAPYWFKLELTGYVSDAANVGARVKASYDVLLTNRLIATPSVETNVYMKKQRDRGLGSGVSNVELGLRLRYEIRRKFAPYVGLVWERSFGGTADFNRREGDPVTERRFVAGLRLWF